MFLGFVVFHEAPVNLDFFGCDSQQVDLPRPILILHESSEAVLACLDSNNRYAFLHCYKEERIKISLGAMSAMDYRNTLGLAA